MSPRSATYTHPFMPLIERLSFPRPAGSDGERRAAALLASELEAAGLRARFEEHPLSTARVTAARIELLGNAGREIPCRGVLLTGETPPGGIEGDFVYIEGYTAESIGDLRGRIVLVNDFPKTEQWSALVGARPNAILVYEGQVDSAPQLFERQLQLGGLRIGRIPTLMIHARDAHELVQGGGGRLRVELRQQVTEARMTNILASVPGTDLGDERILITAHYDSGADCLGACDNASGTAVAIGLAQYFLRRPLRRGLELCLFSGEECGLAGSTAFVRRHIHEASDWRLVLNLDMLGYALGHHRIVSSAHEGCLHWLTYMCAELDFPAELETTICPSDSLPFVKAGIPAINIYRRGVGKTYRHHGPQDRPDNLNEAVLQHSFDFARTLLTRLGDARRFPVPALIPESVRADLRAFELSHLVELA